MLGLVTRPTIHRIPSLLVYDDEIDTIYGLCLTIEDLGWHVAIATVENEAHEQVSSYRFDAILLDWRMPSLNSPGSDEGGQDFIKLLDGGDFGQKNDDCPIFIYTVNEATVPKSILRTHPRCKAIFSKTGDPTPVIDTLSDLMQEPTNGEHTLEQFRLRTIVEVLGQSESEDAVKARIPSWDPDVLFAVPAGNFPTEILDAVRSGNFPSHLIAWANLAANVVEELDVRDFEFPPVIQSEVLLADSFDS